MALRAFPPGGTADPVIGCSIDPTPGGPGGHAAVPAQRLGFQRGHDRASRSSSSTGLRSSLGLQNVSVNGVSPKTHFAQVLVEADYRMKLIGIGLEQPPVRMISYVDRANPAPGQPATPCSAGSSCPTTSASASSEDGLAMELVGDGVKLVGEDELVAAGGQRQARRARRTSPARRS